MFGRTKGQRIFKGLDVALMVLVGLLGFVTLVGAAALIWLISIL